ncbi:MAG: hypothetical protein JWN41_1694 [Thermoleophilia bacterium]|nr:hypothetical protein [Thermoleophilia bacterium]
MHTVLLILTTLVATALVTCAPGAALLSWTRLDQLVPPPLVPGAALVVGMVPLGSALGLTLWLELPIIWVVCALALVTVLGWGAVARRIRVGDERAGTASGAGTASDASASWGRALLTPPLRMVAGHWVRGVPIGAWIVAAATLATALTVGFNTWNDSLYHIGQAQKLLALAHPNFDNTLQFPDGTAHPGYLLPLWQEMIALVAWLTHANPVTVAWIIPGVTVTIGALAMGGLGWALARTPRAAALVMLAWLTSVLIATMPFSEAVFDALQPGEVALDVIVPLVLALLFTALWPSTDSGGAAERPSRWGATAIMCAGVAEIAVLHVSYNMVLALGIIGYLAFWALRSPWPRDVVWRHAQVLVPIAVTAAVATAALLPGLSRLQSFGKTAQQELAINSSAMYEGKLGAPLEALLRGGTEHFHLRPDYLVLGGGLALFGLVCLPLALLAPRWPAAWYLGGSTFVVLAIALSNRLFPRFVHVVSLDQARRIENVLPLSVGLALGAAVTGIVATSLWARGRVAARVAAVLVAAVVAVLAAHTASVVGQLGGYGGETIVTGRWVKLPLVLLTAAIGIYALAMLVRIVRRRRDRTSGDAGLRRRGRLPIAPWEWPTVALTTPAAAVATVVLLVGATPLWGHVGDTTRPVRRDGVPYSQREAELRLFSREVASDLRKLPMNAVVLADPSGRNPYYALALAPVYVVSSVPRHTATTPGNRVPERFADATAFFSPGTVKHPDARAQVALANKRLALLRKYHVTAVIVHPSANAPLMRFLLKTPGITPGAVGKNQRLFHVSQARIRSVKYRAKPGFFGDFQRPHI